MSCDRCILHFAVYIYIYSYTYVKAHYHSLFWGSLIGMGLLIHAGLAIGKDKNLAFELIRLKDNWVYP